MSETLKANYEEKCEQLQTVHAHIKEALEFLGVDVSVNGYIPDSWTLREQCKLAGDRLAAKEAEITEWKSRTLANARVATYLRAAVEYLIDNQDLPIEQLVEYGKAMIKEAEAVTLT